MDQLIEIPFETSAEFNHTDLFRLVEDAYKDPDHLSILRRSFLTEGYVPLPDLLTRTAFHALHAETEKVYAAAKDRSFTMPGYHTLRVLKTLGGRQIVRLCPQLLSVYLHHEIHDLLVALTGSMIFGCEHPEEFFVANFLNRPGSTHGWHLDDPPFALVLFFDAPSQFEGGLMEYIPNWREFCKEYSFNPKQNVNEAVEKARDEGRIKVRHHNRREGYLLRADQCLHRVTELLSENVRRTVINMAYQDQSSVSYEQTADLLYA